jgi:hypothetical protein
MFEISIRAGTFFGTLVLRHERKHSMTWKEIADRKREDRERVSADERRAADNRSRLDEQLPSCVEAIVKAISVQVDAYNAGVVLESDGITSAYDPKTMTAWFQKVSAPAALLTMTVSKPTNNGGRYEASVECVTNGRTAEQEPSTERHQYSITMRDLGLRYQQIGRDRAYSDLNFDRLIDDIITPLVYFVT